MTYKNVNEACEMFPNDGIDAACVAAVEPLRPSTAVEVNPFDQHRNAAFVVASPDAEGRPFGHFYAVYEDGRTAGFPEGSMILNRIGARVRKAFADGRAHGREDAKRGEAA